MGRMTALLPRGGGLLLLLFLLRPLPFLLPGSAGLRLLLSDSSPFNCSQLGLKCVVKNSTCMDESWVHSSVLTPSAPSTVDVHLDIFQDKEGKLLPVLQIQWMVATDASIRSLRGVELTVLQVNDNRQICTWFDFQNNLMLQAPPGGGRWNFTFNRFEVQPGQMYHVTVYHLPKLGIQGDHNRKSKEYKVPDCEDKRMRRTTPCVQMGSLWEPSIDGKHLEDGSVLVSFNPGKEPARYQIHVTGFLDKKICMDTTQEVPKVQKKVSGSSDDSTGTPPLAGEMATTPGKGMQVQKKVSGSSGNSTGTTPFAGEMATTPGRGMQSLQGELQERLNLTIKVVKNIKACCSFRIQIQPFFESCGTDCPRHSASIPCPLPTPTPAPSVSDDVFMWLYWCITGFCIILVGSVIAGAVYMARGPKGAYPGGSGSPPSELLPIRQPPPLKPRKIWIVYSADHPLYVDVVLKFAQFMITVCGTEVALDLLEERQISEVGAMRWLSRQKKEMEELSSKIIILCSRGTRAKWQAMLGNEGMAVSLRQDQRQPAGDLFTPALNLILPDFKKPACFGTYIVCYFEGISDQKDIPDPFNVTSKYQLMDRFEDIYFLIQDLEKFEPGQIHQIPEIAAENYTASLSGKKLKEAVQRFQKWQVEHPNWFERERCCSEDEEDLQSLDQQILEELMLADGGILKRQLLLQEPDSSGCCLVDLHMKEDEDTACRLQPQLNPQGDPACQSTLIVIDEAPRVHVVEPVALVEGENAVSHQLLTSEDWMGEVALLEASAPRRNSILLHEDLDDPTSNDQQAEHHLPDDVRQQLKGLMYSLYQQSITPYEPPLCQEALEQQQLVFDDSSKEQRQSVQSDQGYISRCSPLPSSDDPVEEKEGQEQESLIPAPHFSPDILESLKSLQQQLLFQEIQQNSGWEHTDEMMDTCHSIQGS